MELRKTRFAPIVAAALLLGLAPAASALTFAPPVNISPVGINAQDPPVGVVNSDGSTTVVWRTLGRVGTLQSSRSNTPGVAGSWTAPVDIATVTNTGTSTLTHIPPTPPSTAGASTTATYPRLATDPTRPGWIYMVYSQSPPGPLPPAGGFQGTDHFISPNAEVWFQRSMNRGATWSTPIRVSDPTTYPGSRTIQTRQPNISVSPSGRINVVWQDRRHWYQGPGERNCTHSHNYCEDIRLGDTYYASSLNGGGTFSANIRISDRSHNNDVGYDTRPASGYWSWGPQVVTVTGGRLLIGWMDSREGNWDTDTEDFYLAKLDHEATGPDPETAIDSPNAIARSVALSQRGYQGGNEGALAGGARDPANAGLAGAPGGVASWNSSAVVIVNQTDVAGAMAATVLARANPGPVLLSAAGGLSNDVKAEITRIRPAKAFVVGSEASLSATVVSDVATAAGIAGGQVQRVNGGSDAATARDIAALFDARTTVEKDADTPAFDAAVIANPATPDAAAAVGLAAARRLPILYVGADAVPAETLTALDTLDISKLLVIGGTDEVSAAVETQLDALPKVTQPVTRLGGATQYDTSKAVVTESKARGMPSNIVYMADGTNPMDAALLGGVVARATGMLVLAPTPLYNSVGTLVADYGLTGLVDRFVMLGPARPGAAPAAPAGSRVSPNYNLNSDPSAFRGRDQIGLAVNRTNPDHVVAINANYLDLECEASVSMDAGATWSEAVPLLPPVPALGEAPFSKRCNFHQSVQFGSGQNVYAVVTASRTAPALPDAAVLVYKSADGGVTWERGVVALPAGPGTDDSASASPGPSYTRPGLTVQPGVGGAPDTVYAIGRDFVGKDNSGTAPACDSACGSVKVAVSFEPPPPAVAPPAPPPPPPPVIAPLPPPAATPELGPVLSKVSLTRRSFRARLGTSIRLTLSKNARVRITVAQRTIGRRVGRNCVALTPVNRRRTSCVRFVTKGSLSSNRKQGANVVRFAGRVGGRLLKPGNYRFTVQATDSGNRRSRAISVAFRVVR